MATTRGELRRMIGNTLGDVTELTATALGTTTKLIDAVTFSGAVESPLNRDIIFTSGTNANLIRRVLTYDASGTFITFAAVTAAVAAADTAEMYNFRGRGWRIPEVHRALNQAVEYSWPLYREPYSVSVAAVFDSSTGLLTIPATLTHVYGLQYQDTDLTWRPVPSAVTRYGQGWTVNLQSGVIDVRGVSTIPNGATVRLEGFKKPTALTTDASTTAINPEWLVSKTCAILCMGGVERDPANYNLGQIHDQKAERIKSAIRTRLPSGTVAVV
jgi:hypothetical protein